MQQDVTRDEEPAAAESISLSLIITGADAGLFYLYLALRPLSTVTITMDFGAVKERSSAPAQNRMITPVWNPAFSRL